MIGLIITLSACGGGGSGGGPVGDADGGSADTPTNITLNTAYNSSVGNGDSYFVVSGLTTGTTYAVYAYNLTGDIALYGYVDPGFTVAFFSSDRPGTADEAFSSSPDENGKIYIRVSGANSGGGASFTLKVLPATVTQGSNAAPLDITGSLPFEGTTLNQGSYYVVAGLTPGQRYTVSLEGVIYNPELNVHQHKAFDYAVCTSVNAAWEAESCVAAANFEGKLYIKVSANNGLTISQVGAYYTINVVPATGTELIFEGYDDAPIDLTDSLPYAAQNNRRDSYYTISGLAPGVRYEIRMDNPSVDVQLWVFPGGQFYNSLCTVGYYFTLPTRKSCVAEAPASGSLNIQVPYLSAATYNLDVVLAPVAEGSVASPVTITAPYNGQVDATSSYYVINGLAPDWNYKVSLGDSSNSISVMAGSSTDLTPYNAGTTGRTDLSGSLFIRIDGSDTDGNGAWFTFDLVDANNPEGSVASPIDISLSSPSSPHAGQVDNRTSYYQITGLTPDNYYMTHIGGYTQDVTVYVWDNSSYSGTAKCWFTASPSSTSVNNHCLAPAPAGGTLYIEVRGHASYITGTQYNLWVAPSLLKSEGQSSAIPIAVDTPYAGMVSSYNSDMSSFYVVSGLPGSASYNVVLSNTTDDVDLTVFSDVGLTAELCRSHRRGLYDEHCVATTESGGGSKVLYIKVTASSYTATYDGASYTLNVSAGATPVVNEGTSAVPLDITLDIPRNGMVQASATTTQSSYYKVTGLNPASRYAVMVENPDAPVSLYVYSDASFSSNLCTWNTPLAPVNGACATLPNGAGELFIKTNSSYIADATYSLSVVPAPVADGTQGAPMDLIGSLPYSGQVDGDKSYYMLSGLTAGASYLVSLSKLTDTLQVAVYENAAFTAFVAQSLAKDDVTSVVGTADSRGILYFAVDGFYTSGNGAFFELNVLPAAQSEGSTSEPVTITMQDIPYAGQKAYQSSTNSYYNITGLVPHSSHHVNLRNRTANAWVKVYGDASFTRELCYGSYGDYRIGCAAAANHVGEMFIEVGYTGGFYEIFVP